ncbi:MAG: MerR family transcriptional regulator [Planctomycetaceae bacterium]|nr:MerR family transcriptional regulator [Planctomycetaceae bacterium]
MAAVKPLSIGQVATRAGIGVETIRFYERAGLIPLPARKASGYRQYDESTVSRLRFIRRAKDLGFTLKEIATLLSLRHDASTTARDVKDEAERKIAEIDGKIRSLRRIRRALQQLAETCPGHGPTSECPILEALERHDRASTEE